MKQLPYKQSKEDFITTAIDSHLEELFKKKERKDCIVIKDSLKVDEEGKYGWRKRGNPVSQE